jgi:hypothetical protein
MTLLPELTAEGLLPHDVDLTLDQVLQCGFVTGEGMPMYKWDAELRRRLATNLKTVVERLWAAGFSGEIGVDGSFVKACLRPHDIDVYCVLSDDEALEYDDRLDRLNQLEGAQIWAFGEDERVSVPGFLRPVSPLCGKYGVDLNFDFGQFSGMLGRVAPL